MTDTFPLLTHREPAKVIAYRKGSAVSAQIFCSHAQQLARLLPAGTHVLNVCADRYHFAVGFAACLISGRVSLLPSTHTPEVIRQLKSFAPDTFCLADDRRCDIELPKYFFPDDLLDADLNSPAHWRVPAIPTLQLAAIVFTSGSTGTPLPYKKFWGSLARCMQNGVARLQLQDGRSHTLVGTVPAQHMYGFESSVLLALLSGNAFSSEHPFYPGDIAAAVAAVPRPRVLVTTPVHLRALLQSNIEFPPVDLVISATAPLAQDTAREVESKFSTTLLEIYGSTETGQIAMRRSAETQAWRLWQGVTLRVRDEVVFAHGGHVETSTPMCDVIEMLSDDEFLLHGRTADLVNIAGKRSSFAYLNAQLNAIDGVLDGAFYLRENSTGGTGVARLGAVVVAPQLTHASLLEQLKQRIDGTFLPRPLLLVDKLPRNSTGKLPQQALHELARRGASNGTEPMRSALGVAADHPSYAGHFPSFPVLPGAVLLDETLRAVEAARGIDLTRWQIASAKFLDVVRPGDELMLEHEAASPSVIRFVIRVGERKVASGALAAIV